MSTAVYLYTLAAKFSSISSILGIIFLAVGMPVLFSTMSLEGRTVDAMVSMLKGPALAMGISYMFIQDNIANTRQLNDGEYLALLFSRPLTRFQYVVSKWLAGATGVFVIMLLNLVCFNLAQLVQSHSALVAIDAWSVGDLLLNSLSYSALMVLIRSFPLRLGVAVFVILVYISFIGSALNFSTNSFAGELPVMHYTFLALSSTASFLRAFVFPSLQLYDVVNTTRFSWLPILNFASNLTLYLVFAGMILNRREFSYGED